LLDRIDIHLEVPAVKYKALTGESAGEPSEAMRERVDPGAGGAARAVRHRPGIYANAHMAPRDIRAHCKVSDGADALLRPRSRGSDYRARLSPAFSRSRVRSPISMRRRRSSRSM